MAGVGPAVEALHRHAEALAASVVEAVGSDAVDTIFVGGSLPAGTVAAFDAGDALEIYSDVDLYVVLRDGTDEAALRRKARQAARRVEPPPGTRMFSDSDVGVYTRAGLFAQPPRPGTAYLGSCHRLLLGDGDVVRALPDRIGDDIDPKEGLYLIENRLAELEWMPVAEDAGARRYRRYVLVKTTLDVVGACVIAAGRYAPGIDERLAAVESGPKPGGWDAALIRAAADGVRDLQGFLAGEPEFDWDARVRRLAVDVWGEIGARLFPGARRDRAAMVLLRCGAGAYKRNLRQFVALSGGLGWTRPRRIWAGARLSRFSPVDALRVSGLADCVRNRQGLDAAGKRSLGSLAAFLERLTRTCGFVEGPLPKRVGAMYRAVT